MPAGTEKNQLQRGAVPASYKLLVDYEDRQLTREGGWTKENAVKGKGIERGVGWGMHSSKTRA